MGADQGGRRLRGLAGWLALLEAHIRPAHDESGDCDECYRCRFFSLIYLRLDPRDLDGDLISAIEWIAVREFAHERKVDVSGAVPGAVVALRATKAKQDTDILGGPGRTRTCNQTVMSGRL